VSALSFQFTGVVVWTTMDDVFDVFVEVDGVGVEVTIGVAFDAHWNTLSNACGPIS